MTLFEAIMALHPSARFPQDFVVSRNAETDEDEIVKWNADTLGAQDDAALAAEMEKPSPVAIPDVSSAQAKIQLSRTPGREDGKTMLDDVTAAVQGAGVEAQIWFSEARSWQRSNPYVASLSAGLKLTSAQVDELFLAAAQIAA